MSYETKVPKDYRPLVRAAIDQGWTLTQRRTGHPKLTSPDGSYSSPIPSSSGARATYHPIRCRLRRNGLIL